MTENTVVVCGEVLDEPQWSHRAFGEDFYCFSLAVRRLSGQTDRLPVVYSERLCERPLIRADTRLCIEGQVRTYNLIEENKSRLRLQIFARVILPAPDDAPDENRVLLEGFVCKTPVYRVTPFLREIGDVLLAVNRSYGKSDYIPVICWGRNARYAEGLDVGEKLHIEGRLQSRVYQKKLSEEETEERTTYEVSASLLFKPEHPCAYAGAMTERFDPRL